METIYVVPGRSIGEIELGMPKNEAERICRSDPFYTRIQYDDTDRVDYIEVGSPSNFPYMGLGLWRPAIFTEADVYEEWYKEWTPELQEDKKG